MTKELDVLEGKKSEYALLLTERIKLFITSDEKLVDKIVTEVTQFQKDFRKAKYEKWINKEVEVKLDGSCPIPRTPRTWLTANTGLRRTES